MDRRPISKSLRFKILHRDNFTCQYCGATPGKGKLEIDHKTPVSKGGKNEEINLITSCFDCNRGKRDKLLSVGKNNEKWISISDAANYAKIQKESVEQWAKLLGYSPKPINGTFFYLFDIRDKLKEMSEMLMGGVRPTDSAIRIILGKEDAKFGLSISAQTIEHAIDIINNKLVESGFENRAGVSSLVWELYLSEKFKLWEIIRMSEDILTLNCFVHRIFQLIKIKSIKEYEKEIKKDL